LLKQNETRIDDYCKVATDDLKVEGMLIAAEIDHSNS
jgi:D-ribose pyranose/furanose isomerase RbsD